MTDEQKSEEQRKQLNHLGGAAARIALILFVSVYVVLAGLIVFECS